MPHIKLRRRAALVLVLLGLSPAGAAAQQSAANPYFEFLQARRLEGEGDLKGALAALERAAAADPKSAEVKAEIAGLHFRRNPPARAEAEKAARDALALDEANVEANRTLGYLIANGLQTTDDVKNAIRYLERAAAGTVGTDQYLQFLLGQMYLRNKEPQKAVQAVARVVQQNPGSPQARQLLATAHAAAGNLKGAISTLEEVVDFIPTLAPELARYLEQDGQLIEAAGAYTLALTQQPNNSQLKLQRIAVLYNAKQFQQAADFAGEAKRQHPGDTNFPRIQARALFDAGDKAGAVTVAEAAAKAFPKDLQTQLTLANLDSNSGRSAEAIAIAETAAKTFPKEPQAQFTLVDAYSDGGRSSDAERVLRQMLANEPSNARVLNHLGYLLARRGEQLDEAVTLVRRALAVDPDRPEYLDSLGWAYFKRGEFNEAVKYLLAAADKLPSNSEVQDHLGDAYARRGSLPDAIAAWTKALAGDGQGVEKAEIERKLEDARRKLPK